MLRWKDSTKDDTASAEGSGAPSATTTVSPQTLKTTNEAFRGRPTTSIPARSQLPLSMTLFRVAGMCCRECHDGSSLSQPQNDTKNDNDVEPDGIGPYDLQELKRQNSAASALVLAPMLRPPDDAVLSRTESILAEYIAACRFYGCGDRINAGVLTTLRFQLPSLRVTGSFHDADMLALVEVLLKHVNGHLAYLTRLDFSVASKEGKLHGRPGFRSHGALALSKVLQVSRHVTEVYCPRNRMGPYGACALFIASSTNPTLRKLILRRCRIMEQGAMAFCEYILKKKNDPKSTCGLTEVDLSANYIGFRGCYAIDQALLERAVARQQLDLRIAGNKKKDGNGNHDDDLATRTMNVDLDGNLVFQEIMNGVTHGLGVCLAVLAGWALSHRVSALHPMSNRHWWSCAIYSTSLLVLYVSSTLYHSFFTMRNTKWIFETLDKCAIYILIAGSYTPFLQIVLCDKPIWSIYLLAFLWGCCACGIGVEAFLPAWRYRTYFSLAMYLGMGWSALVCLPEVATLLPAQAMHLMLLGGVAYTAGVPFFVRNNNLDHAVWHVFVLAGSALHWAGIYVHVAPFVCGGA